MKRKDNALFRTPHHRAYFAAAMLLLGGVLAVAVIALLFFDVGADPEEVEMYRLAAIWIPMHFAVKWLVSRPIAGQKLSEHMAEQLASLVPFSLVVALITKAETTTLWSGLCQIIGGWVLIFVIVMLTSLAFDAALARFKAYRTARHEKRHAD